MFSVYSHLNASLTTSVEKLFGQVKHPIKVELSKLGGADYQSSFTLGLSKTVKQSPEEIVTKIGQQITQNDPIIQHIFFTAPGFLNIM